MSKRSHLETVYRAWSFKKADLNAEIPDIDDLVMGIYYPPGYLKWIPFARTNRSPFNLSSLCFLFSIGTHLTKLLK